MPDVTSHTVTGGGGISLRVDETGNRTGRPIVFIHGYSQSRLAWDKQMDSALADAYRLVAVDNRGHGASDKPREAYDDPRLWADDVQGVIDALGLDEPVLVGWSYGGVVISDYLQVHGERDIAAANFVGAVSSVGPAARSVTGEEFLALYPGFASTDAEESVHALETLVDLCVAGDLRPQDRYYMLGFNVIVPPYVRAGLQFREIEHDEVLRDLDIPVLLTHGEEDRIVLPAAADDHLDLIPNAEVSWYPGVGHSPFWEAPDRFNTELRDFIEGL